MITRASNAQTGQNGGTIAKPSGLTVGDVMLAITCGTGGISVPSGWTHIWQEGSSYGQANVCAKVADASDVAASSFNFNGQGGIIYRLTEADINKIRVDNTATQAAVSAAFVFRHTSDNDSDSASFSGGSISGGMSPSMSDDYSSAGSSTTRTSLGVSSGIYTSASNVSGYSLNQSGSPDDSRGPHLILVGQAAPKASGFFFGR